MAGWLYVVTIAGGLFAEFYVAGKLIVSSDAKATAANILASEALFRMATVSEIVLGAASWRLASCAKYQIVAPFRMWNLQGDASQTHGSDVGP